MDFKWGITALARRAVMHLHCPRFARGCFAASEATASYRYKMVLPGVNLRPRRVSGPSGPSTPWWSGFPIVILHYIPGPWARWWSFYWSPSCTKGTCPRCPSAGSRSPPRASAGPSSAWPSPGRAPPLSKVIVLLNSSQIFWLKLSLTQLKSPWFDSFDLSQKIWLKLS